MLGGQHCGINRVVGPRLRCSPDNAACEGFFWPPEERALLLTQLASTTIEDFMAELDAYIRWYNEAWIKISLGARSPIEFVAAWGSVHNPTNISAASPKHPLRPIRTCR